VAHQFGLSGLRPYMRKPVRFILILLILGPAFVSADTGKWHFFDKKPVEVYLTGRFDILDLAGLKIDIDSVRDNVVLAYVTEEEFKTLQSRGVYINWVPDAEKITRDLQLQTTRSSQQIKTGEFYHTYEELSAELQAVASDNPDLCLLESAGQTVQGRELWWIKISDNVDTEEEEPEFHYIATMHGNEPVGTELCLRLINYLVDYYNVSPRITELINNTEIWIMPLMNPDGYTAGSRYNANGVNLNRNFPDQVADPVNTTAGREPETTAIMNWALMHSPTLSANFHSGALVVSYPWDGRIDIDGDDNPDLNPDNDLFVNISEAYAILNEPMYNGQFYHGISIGQQWYPIYGGMQDWAYVWIGCNEVTIELHDTKWPDPSLIPVIWEDNREAMITYIEQSHIGIRGVVTDAVTGTPIPAEVCVNGIDHSVYTDPQVGNYHRMLLPGAYTLNFYADGYISQEREITVMPGAAAILDVQLLTGNTKTGGGGGCFVGVVIGKEPKKVSMFQSGNN